MEVDEIGFVGIGLTSLEDLKGRQGDKIWRFSPVERFFAF
jgi:hypothetical protein